MVRQVVLAGPVLAPVALLFLLRSVPRLDIGYQDADFHLVFVSAIAACALAVAVVAGSAGARSAHYGPVWLAVGCLAVGTLMVGHGLTTPGVLGQPPNLWVARLPYLAILAFAAALALASRPRNAASSRLATRYPRAVIVVAAAACSTLVAAVVSDPARLSGLQPLGAEDALHWAAVILGSAAFLVLAVVHWRRWVLGTDPVQVALMLAASMSAAALWSLRFGELWQLSWWDYHGFLLAGFAGAVYAITVRYRRTLAVEGVLAATFETDPMVHIVDGYPDALKALVRSVEVKDRYTHGHSERTARFAVQLGIRLGLPEDRLRALARGAYLHDVGKIAIPDEILNKPGRLNPEERTIIETHPEVGHGLVEPAASLAEALPVVLHHHERWDGTGYPHGLAGSDIPLIARVAAVADVWDALTSDRSYRAGMAPRVALAHIVAGRGTHFEPRVVDALVSLAADLGYRTADEPGDVEVAEAATETCHEATATRA
ncbi:HD-GYP domain-containing protein [Aquihabitans sp. G128]|uniref:HD-GYP domain-containing protein n=1 Tax=Aquihabitans sp. G128 TaxID=2849779 RepID=UPI001C2254E7|nr:HD-GYP domain-containing protein [Aquihabitans sp. G128]QXC59377.1 HD-GYP domain-containing protein [Aquihabitans sp. G128]